MALEILITFYCLVSLAIRLRFQLINELLIDKYTNCKKFQQKILTVASQLHIHLCDAIHNVNKIFSLAIGFFFFFNLTSVIFSIFELYLSVVNSNRGAVIWQFTAMTNLWSFYMVFFMLTIVQCCQKTLDEEKKIEMNVLYLLKIEVCDERKKMIWTFVQQCRHLKPQFSCGLFHFNWKFMALVSL